MEFSDLQPGGEWAVFESIGPWTGRGPRLQSWEVDVGVKGYVKRNKFQPDQLQVLARTVCGVVAGFYMAEREASYKLLLIKPVPVIADPDLHWHNYWESWK